MEHQVPGTEFNTWEIICFIQTTIYYIIVILPFYRWRTESQKREVARSLNNWVAEPRVKLWYDQLQVLSLISAPHYCAFFHGTREGGQSVQSGPHVWEQPRRLQYVELPSLPKAHIHRERSFPSVKMHANIPHSILKRNILFTFSRKINFLSGIGTKIRILGRNMDSRILP